MSVAKLKDDIREAYRFADTLKASYESLRDASLSISAQLARAGYLKANARRDHSLTKQRVVELEEELKRIDATLYLRFREEMAAADSKGKMKPPTEGTISAAILASDEHEFVLSDLRDARLAEIDAHHLVDLTWDLVEALKVRSTMINSLAADRRAELSTDFLLRKQAQEAAEDRDSNT